jgi:hypothetical protein
VNSHLLGTIGAQLGELTLIRNDRSSARFSSPPPIYLFIDLPYIK